MPTVTTYSYAISTDFPKLGGGAPSGDGVANTSKLATAIRGSSIVTALDRIDTSGDTCDIVFKDVLSVADKTTLDGDTTGPAGGLIASTDNTPSASRVQEVSLRGGSTKIGMEAVQVLSLPDLSSDFVKSWQITAAAQTTEIRDIYIGDDLVGATGKCYLAGGEYRCRTDVAEGSALSFQIVDRDDVLGLFALYGLSRTKLSGLTSITGSIAVGDSATGGTSGAVSEVLWVEAVGSIGTATAASYTDGQTFTLTDYNAVAVTFEFDVTGDGVGGGNVAVDISGVTTADEVRDTIIAAVNGATIDITASNGGVATVALSQDGGGSEGWTSITTTGTPPGTYTDFTGDFVEITFHDGPFTDGEPITFTSGTATLGTWDEGDVVVVLTSLKDEWIEGLDERSIHPGGSKEVPAGMYFRVKCFNSDTTNPLRVKVSLTVGRL